MINMIVKKVTPDLKETAIVGSTLPSRQVVLRQVSFGEKVSHNHYS